MNKKQNNFDMADDYILPNEKIDCIHVFSDSIKIIKDYSPDLCNKIIEHGRSGLLINGFAGKYNISVMDMCDWLSKPKEYPDFVTAARISHSACIHYHNEELLHYIKLQDWQAVARAEATLAGLMKFTPKELTEGLYSNLNVKTAQDLQKEAQQESDQAFQNNILG